jgi:hypothetical protein
MANQMDRLLKLQIRWVSEDSFNSIKSGEGWVSREVPYWLLGMCPANVMRQCWVFCDTMIVVKKDP